jgi:hypothetical protein
VPTFLKAFDYAQTLVQGIVAVPVKTDSIVATLRCVEEELYSTLQLVLMDEGMHWRAKPEAVE